MNSWSSTQTINNSKLLIWNTNALLVLIKQQYDDDYSVINKTNLYVKDHYEVKYQNVIKKVNKIFFKIWLKEICQIIYYLYQAKEITKEIYNNMINSTNSYSKMDNIFMILKLVKHLIIIKYIQTFKWNKGKW